MKRAKLLKNYAGYTASTSSIKVVAQNIKAIRIGFVGLENTTTANTLPNTIAHSSAVKLTVGGEVITLIRHDDLFALNFALDLLKMGMANPSWLLGTGTDNTYTWLKTILPVFITTDKTVYVSLDYTGVTNVDGTTLTLEVDYGDKPYSRNPLCLRYISMNTATSFTEADISVVGKKLIGLLVFSTTIPATIAYDTSAGEIKLLVKREEKCHFHWFCLDNVEADVEDTVVWGILDNYRYIDLSDDPIPADDLKVAVKSLVSATDAVRFIGVYQ